jgi:hypothetical protein
VNYIQSLQDAIRKAYGCESKHIESDFVREMFQGTAIWVGTVEVFDLTGHPTARRAYAWGHATRDAGKEVRIVTVLGVPPVDSPRKAVQVSIVADAKENEVQK